MYHPLTSSPTSIPKEKYLDLEDMTDGETLRCETEDLQPLPRKNSRCRQLVRQALIHSMILAVYTVIVYSFWPKTTCRESFEIPSPALEAVHWEVRTFENSLETANPYKGEPRPELDRAWNKLLAPSAIRVSKQDLESINRSSIAILDGNGYFGTLDVHHQLHCLRWVRQALHPEYYKDLLTAEQNRGQHIDHCLDALRQFIMCKADVSLLTYDWIPQFHRPWPNFEVQHKCVNWDHIQEWAESHSFNGFDDNLIRHPNFHPKLASPFSYDVSGNESPTVT